MLIIAAADLLKIERFARDAYPEECCGILVGVRGDARRVVSVHPTANMAPQGTRDSYLIDPRDMERTLERLQAPLEVLGFYHSHPDFPPVPSAKDALQAWHNYSYLIVSVRGGEPIASRSWHWPDPGRGYEQETVQIIPAGRRFTGTLEALRRRVQPQVAGG